jgi:magnesium transporter
MEAESAGARSGTVIDLMEPMTAVVREDQTASSAVDLLVHHPTPEDVSYVYVIDAGGRLVGVFGMRDLLLAKPSQLVSDIMVRDPVTLAPDLLLANAMGTVLKCHYSRYPVVDEGGMPLGQVRGWKLVERTVAEIGNQPGSMVGVDRHERVGTPLLEAFRMRHPWLQVNLLTAFMAAFVVSLFDDTIARVVALAAFLPVLAGQSGNTGCQALAITLRGMTLGELAEYPVGRLLRVVAAIAMWGYAAVSDAPQPATLALVVLLAMIGACIGSGIFGVLVPVTLRRFGADPAMASSIFLTTFTDILGMGLMLLLATVLLA